MMDSAKLSRRARELAPEDRARLAEELMESLEVDVDSAVDANLDAALRKRIAEIEAGSVALVPAAEVFAKARRTLR